MFNAYEDSTVNDEKFYLDETKAWKVSMRILKYLTLIAIVLGVYTYYPHSDVRNLEAEKYFMTELNKVMKDRDVLETDLTGFTKFPWSEVCIGHSYNGVLEMVFIKDTYLRDTINILDLSRYMHVKASEKYISSSKKRDLLWYTCPYRGRKFMIKKVPNNDRYIFKIMKRDMKLENQKGTQ